MKTLTYINTHPSFNRFNSILKDELQNANIPVKILKSPKPYTYVLNVDERDYEDSFKLLLDVRLRNGYASLLKSFEDRNKPKAHRR